MSNPRKGQIDSAFKNIDTNKGKTDPTPRLIYDPPRKQNIKGGAKVPIQATLKNDHHLMADEEIQELSITVHPSSFIKDENLEKRDLGIIQNTFIPNSDFLSETNSKKNMDSKKTFLPSPIISENDRSTMKPTELTPFIPIIICMKCGKSQLKTNDNCSNCGYKW